MGAFIFVQTNAKGLKGWQRIAFKKARVIVYQVLTIIAQSPLSHQSIDLIIFPSGLFPQLKGLFAPLAPSSKAIRPLSYPHPI